jgi:MarR family transcriptional regulator, organic hydroperoxide resistance regulator
MVSARDELVRMNEALRQWYAAFAQLEREFAIHQGLHGSDAAALVHITDAEDRGAPLSQAQLARRVGLTTPATSSLLNRLEHAGHVERHRSNDDRRVVTLRSTAAVHAEIERFFEDVGADVDRVAASHPPGSVPATTALLADITQVLQRHLGELESRRR